MIQLDTKREWEILHFEMFENKPPIKGSYPENIVKRRECLLLAQCMLSEFEFAESKINKAHFGAIYLKVMESYFAWKVD